MIKRSSVLLFFHGVRQTLVTYFNSIQTATNVHNRKMDEVKVFISNVELAPPLRDFTPQHSPTSIIGIAFYLESTSIRLL